MQSAHYYSVYHWRKKNMMNLMGVKMKICLNISVSKMFTCKNKMLDKYLN